MGKFKQLRVVSKSSVSTSELDILDGVTATTAELNISDQMPASVSFAAAAGASNVCDVVCTVLNAAGVAIASVHQFDLLLSDAATGAGITGTTTSGTVTAKSASGVVLDTYTSKKSLRVQTLATGIFTLEITDTAKTGFYVVADLDSTGVAQVSSVLVTGNYG